MTTHRCKECGAPLCTEEMSLYKKIVYRGAQEFLCLSCLSGNLQVPRERLVGIVAYYHKVGTCQLFAKVEGWEPSMMENT